MEPVKEVISTRFAEGHKRRPEDGELDSYETGLHSYWRRSSRQQGNNYAATVEGKTLVVQEGNGTSPKQSRIVSCDT
jgi:hypothetical protein